MTQHRILFVGLGNIRRSPLVEAAMRQLIAEDGRLDDFLLDSAGTSNAHAGEPPDPRAAVAAAAVGITLERRRARHVTASDFRNCDLLLAMDTVSREALLAMAPLKANHKIHRLLDFSPWIGETEIADPYFGDAEAFDDTLDLIRLAVRGLLSSLDQEAGEWAVATAPRARLKLSSGM